jgi:hypothetical protein
VGEMGERGKGKGEREILDCFIEYESLFILQEFLEMNSWKNLKILLNSFLEPLA